MERNIRAFFGAIGTGWKTTFEYSRPSPQNIIPWDCVPGSTQSISGRNGSFGDVSSNPAVYKNQTFGGNIWRAIVYPLVHVRTNFSVPFEQDLFSFVPITSALDVANITINSFNRSRIFDRDGAEGSNSAKYIAQEIFTEQIDGVSSTFNNKNHTDFTARNAKWIFNEMEQLPQGVDCFTNCNNTYLINGDNTFCGTSNPYTIPNLPSDASVTWSANPSDVVTINTPNNTSTTLTRLRTGAFTLTATITSSCFPNKVINRENMFTGTPGFGGFFYNGVSNNQPLKFYDPNDPNIPNSSINNVCLGYSGYYVEATPYGGGTVSWNLASGFTANSNFSFYQQGNRAYFSFGYPNANAGYLRASTSNACGSYSQVFAFKQYNCNGTGPGGDPCNVPTGNYFTTSPNPSVNEIIVKSTTNRPPPPNCKTSASLPQQSQNSAYTFNAVNIYNRLGTLLKTSTFNDATKSTININNLPTGSYVVEIISGNYKEQQIILVQK